MENLDPELKTLFDQVGVTAEELKDKETAEFIYDFIEQQGGIDRVKQDIRMSKAPPPPPPASRDFHHMAPPAGELMNSFITNGIFMAIADLKA